MRMHQSNSQMVDLRLVSYSYSQLIHALAITQFNQLEETHMHQSNETIVRHFIDAAINNKQLDAIDEFIHPDYIFRTPTEEIHGREALKDLLSAYHTALPDMHVHIDESISANDQVVLLLTLTGTHENEMMGIQATGNQIKVNGVIRSRLDNGQIIEEWELLDQLTMFQQLDMVSI